MASSNVSWGDRIGPMPSLRMSMFACGSVPAISMGQAARPTLGLRRLPDSRRSASGPPRDSAGALREPGAAGSARQSKELRRLSACLNALAPEGREIVLPAYHYGLTREQISKRVDRPVGTVKSSLRQSLAQFKECLGR